MVIKKNQILTATLLIALCGAVFINWYYGRPTKAMETGNLGEAEFVNSKAVESTTKKAVNTVSEYFANSELKRKNAHDKALGTINSVITNKDSSKEAVQNATKELSDLSNLIKTEADLENILSAKLGSDCIVILNAGKAEIIVENSKLNENAISVVKTTILEQTDVPVSNIAIIGAK